MKPQTVKTKKSVIDSQLDPYFFPYGINNITEEIVFSFKEHILKQHFSKEYNIHIFSTLSCLFKFCVKTSLIEKNVFYGCSTVFKKVDRCEFWSKEEFDRFISYFDNDLLFKTFFSLLFLTDIKQYELRTLTIEDIDLSKGEITVHQRLLRRKKKGKRERLITFKGTDIRNHKINSYLVQLLKDYLLENHFEIDDFLFPIRYTEMFYKKRESCEYNHLKEISFHPLKNLRNKYVL